MTEAAAPALEGYARYAIYYTPPEDSPLGRLGAAWFAEDEAEAGPPAAALPRPRPDLVSRPRRYGLHATLRAPFRPASGVTPEALDETMAALARSRPPARATGLEVAAELGFVALLPTADTGELDALAAACVVEFDALRAPLDAEEIARRETERLSPDDRRRLLRWGYPQVLEAFRFHITLTRQLPPEEAAQARAVLAEWLAPALAAPFTVDALSLVGDPGDGKRFRVLRRRPLTGSREP